MRNRKDHMHVRHGQQLFLAPGGFILCSTFAAEQEQGYSELASPQRVCENGRK